MKDVVSEEDQKKLQKKFVEGKLTLRDMQSQLQAAMQMGPIENILGMLPGFSNMELPKGIDANSKLRGLINIFDSMTAEELDSRTILPLSQSRILRIAKGSYIAYIYF